MGRRQPALLDSSSNNRIDQVLSGKFDHFHCLILADSRKVIKKINYMSGEIAITLDSAMG